LNTITHTIQKTISSVDDKSYACSITVDCAVFGFQEGILKLLLVKRAIEPYKNRWLLPGGAIEEGQSLDDAMNAVLFHLTGIDKIHKEQVRCYGEVDRHPVRRVVTLCFYALIKPENHPVIPKSYVSEVKWVPFHEIPSLGFDHDILVRDAYDLLQRNLEEKLLFDELLPEKFTLKELQDLYEAILNVKLDRRNFRKKMMQKDLLINTGEKKPGAKGGPELYKLK
jgi:8-oxo-dGTP diphosphatase